MHILQLGHLGIAATDIAPWRAFAEDFLGLLAVARPAGRLALRMDERRQRFLVEPAARDGLAWIGLDVADAAALGDLTAHLRRAGHEAVAGTAEETDAREVAGLAWLHDPDGNRVEFHFGARGSEEPFVSPRPIGGFRTGELGIGHVVLQTTRFDAMQRFYGELLGFRLSDYMAEGAIRANFMHVNPRHHSLALIDSDVSRLHHVMIEFNYLDDVGRLYDKALAEEGRVAVTLGRHSNDHMTSFYSSTPGGFMIETGWAGRLIDDATWQPEALYGPSIWGHERSWLPPEAQAAARKQRDNAAAAGVLAPTEVIASPAFGMSRYERADDAAPASARRSANKEESP
jgi:2,3-dihydroxybiphenyl 1,2-dioxygenase